MLTHLCTYPQVTSESSISTQVSNSTRKHELNLYNPLQEVNLLELGRSNIKSFHVCLFLWEMLLEMSYVILLQTAGCLARYFYVLWRIDAPLLRPTIGTDRAKAQYFTKNRAAAWSEHNRARAFSDFGISGCASPIFVLGRAFFCTF